MVTGDHPVTALAIARELGMAAHAEEVVTGTALESVGPDALRELIARARVFARVTPEQKLAIVEAAQRAGHYVAVTGDGVNDAPALRRANIGVAMGRGGTDVAREAADLVLSDDNFATIVHGIEQGRIAYRNVRNVVYLLIAAGIAEVLTVALAVFAGLPLPLLPVQLLWLNLVTNGIQDVGLAFERGHGDELDAPPRRPDEPLIDRLMLERGLLAGLWMSLLGFAWFAVLLHAGTPVTDARNELLMLMVLMQNVDAFNARSETRSVFKVPLAGNPLLAAGVLFRIAAARRRDVPFAAAEAAGRGAAHRDRVDRDAARRPDAARRDGTAQAQLGPARACGRASPAPASTEPGSVRRPPMSAIQPGILAPVPRAARHLTFILESEAGPAPALERLARAVDPARRPSWASAVPPRSRSAGTSRPA